MLARPAYLFFLFICAVAIATVAAEVDVEVTPSSIPETVIGGDPETETEPEPEQIINPEDLDGLDALEEVGTGPNLVEADELLDNLDEKYGATHKEFDDEEIDKFDEGWEEQQLRHKMAFCFDTAQSHIQANRDQFRAIAIEAAKEKGIREDDALRMFMYGALLSCYFKAGKEELLGEITQERRGELLFHSGDMPARMSQKQMKMLDSVLQSATVELQKKADQINEEKEKNKEKEGPPGDKKGKKPERTWQDIVLTGRRGQVLGIIVVGVVGALLYWGMLVLSNMQHKREFSVGRPGKLTKSEKQLTKKRR